MFTINDLEATRTPEEVVAFRNQVAARATELETEWAGKTFDQEAREEFAGLRDLKTKADERESEFRARREWVQSLATDESRTEKPQDFSTRTSRPTSRIPDDPFDLSEYRARTTSEQSMAALMRDGAKKVADDAFYPHPDATKERSVEQVHKLLQQDPSGTLARHILATGSPVYARAFAKYLAGAKSFTADEARAIDVVGSGALTTGGYAVPFTLDPTVILTSDGSVNPLRQIARVERLVQGNTWKGVTSAGITVSRGPAEDQPVNPTSPTFGQPEVTVQPVKVEIQYSIEADEDWPRLQTELARMLQEAKDDEEAESFVNGVGTTVYPGGIVETLDASSHVGTTGDGLDISDFDVLEGRLGAKYRARARYLANHAIYQAVDRFAITTTGAGGAYRPNRAAGLPSTLNGYPAHEISTMEDDVTATGEVIAIFGDFSNFLIVDKVGLTIEIDPHVRNGDGKWIGKRALLAHYRNSSVILNDAAFRALVVGVVTS